MTDSFLLDTCVLSEVSKRQPNPNVIRFLDTSANLFLPAAALMEFQLGIAEASSSDPVRAVRLSNWYSRTVTAGLPILDTTREVAEVWGVLAADPRLRNLVVGHARAKKPRNGQDLHIAACALVHRLPIATMNVSDFSLIDRCYPLPGIYDPLGNRWHARMSPLQVQEQSAVAPSFR
ncbi:PIN domain-containing protein [Endobacterium cereale]|uniref:PIN domain-containing protein n=1 Tax=Endobacterium cereale TaxID=2663029 RepID=UPI0030829A56